MRSPRPSPEKRTLTRQPPLPAAGAAPARRVGLRGAASGSVMAAPSNFYAALMNMRLSSEDGSDSPTFASMAARGTPTTSTTNRSGSSSGGGGKTSKRSDVSTKATAAATAGSTTAAEEDAPAKEAADGDTAATTAAAAATAPSAKKRKLPNPLVWIDLEMTGLDVERDTIIEIACLVTDGELKHVVEGPSLVIHHSEEVIEGMNDWCKEHHGKSGLTQRVRDSTTSLAEAEAQVLAFVQTHTEFKSAQLAGNSVHVDRMFLAKHMPTLLEHLHYRIVDVSSIGEVARRWSPKLARCAPRKKAAHTAMSDIRESLEELRYYKEKLFKGVK